MYINIFTIKDSKADSFLQPCFFHNEDSFKRAVATITLDTKHNFHMYPEDFALYELGSYDDSTGALIPLDQPRHICSMTSIKNQTNEALKNG